MCCAAQLIYTDICEMLAMHVSSPLIASIVAITPTLGLETIESRGPARCHMSLTMNCRRCLTLFKHRNKHSASIVQKQNTLNIVTDILGTPKYQLPVKLYYALVFEVLGGSHPTCLAKFAKDCTR